MNFLKQSQIEFDSLSYGCELTFFLKTPDQPQQKAVNGLFRPYNCSWVYCDLAFLES